jgi:D-sedoheptulose 7-phosphate isomerase
LCHDSALALVAQSLLFTLSCEGTVLLGFSCPCRSCGFSLSLPTHNSPTSVLDYPFAFTALPLAVPAPGDSMARPSQFERRARHSIEASIAVKRSLLRNSQILSGLSQLAASLIHAFERGNKVLLFGNGGSATDAQHIAAELVGRFAFDRPALPALSLATNLSAVTAIANDHGFRRVFSRQIEAFGRPGDVAIAISTSGNSRNVLQAVALAKKMRMHTAALTGRSGGKLKSIVDFCLRVPSDDTPRIQECHLLLGHILSEIVEQELFAPRASARSSPNPRK